MSTVWERKLTKNWSHKPEAGQPAVQEPESSRTAVRSKPKRAQWPLHFNFPLKLSFKGKLPLGEFVHGRNCLREVNSPQLVEEFVEKCQPHLDLGAKQMNRPRDLV